MRVGARAVDFTKLNKFILGTFSLPMAQQS